MFGDWEHIGGKSTTYRRQWAAPTCIDFGEATGQGLKTLRLFFRSQPHPTIILVHSYHPIHQMTQSVVMAVEYHLEEMLALRPCA